MYEILVQWASVGSREVDVDWLRSIFQVQDKYKTIKDFKKYIIDPAIIDINEHSNIWVKYGQRKSGRTITHFQFDFGLKSKTPSPKKKHITEEEINRHAKPGESRNAVIARLTGTSIVDFAKPGETFDHAMDRKKALQEVKNKLR